MFHIDWYMVVRSSSPAEYCSIQLIQILAIHEQFCLVSNIKLAIHKGYVNVIKIIGMNITYPMLLLYLAGLAVQTYCFMSTESRHLVFGVFPIPSGKSMFLWEQLKKKQLKSWAKRLCASHKHFSSRKSLLFIEINCQFCHRVYHYFVQWRSGADLHKIFKWANVFNKCLVRRKFL